MNKLTNILLATIVALFLLSFGMKSEAMGQCPNGFYTHKIDTLLIDSCYYEVDLCIECTVTHPGNVTYNSIRKLDSTCINSLDPAETVEQVLSQVSTWTYYYNYVCGGDYPPCDTGPGKQITFKYPTCWYMRRDYNGELWYYPCDNSAYCEETYEVCMQMPEMILQKTQIGSSTLIGNITCSLEGFRVQPPTTPNSVSECYIVHTTCNP